MEAKFYQVGGCVRDRLLGLPAKDIDFAVEAESYDAMRAAVLTRVGGDEKQIKVEKPEFVTIRAIDPQLGGVDFVLCRKDGTYTDGRRPDSVTVGTLHDDLARRDFTINAMAEAEDGTIIDPFNGRVDLLSRTIRCVGNAGDRFNEDRLRMLRAIRFAITKRFSLDISVIDAIEAMGGLHGVSFERIREELLKCFEHDTLLTLAMLDDFPNILRYCFAGNKLILKPTLRA